MKNERILIADDEQFVIDSFSILIDAFSDEGDHKIVGKATSGREVEKLLRGGLKPTLALVDGFNGKGGEVAKIIKELSPETYIVAYSASL